MKAPKKKVVKITVGILVPVLLIAIFLAVFLNDKTTVEVGDISGKYAKVLSNIDGIVEANPRLIDIAMLGAHDAGTNGITIDSEASASLDNSAGGAVNLAKGCIYRYAKTQTIGVGQQIRQGARFIHLKYTRHDGVWYSTHSLLSYPLENYVVEVLQYLASDDAKGEIVCLLFQCEYFEGGFTLDDFHNYLATISYQGKTIYDYVYFDDLDVFDHGYGNGKRIGELTYNDLTKNGTAPGLVLFDNRNESVFEVENEGSNALMQKFFDLDSCCINEWHSTIGQDSLMDAIDETSHSIEITSRYDYKMRINQSQSAFSVSGIADFFNSIGAWSLLRFARKYNLSLIESSDFDEILYQMPVFQVDYVNSDYGDFNNKVNQLIILHNQNVVNALLGR